MTFRLATPGDARARSGVVRTVLLIAAFTTIAIVIQGRAGTYRADLSVTSDESSHFTSAAMIHDYIVAGRFESPLKFSIDYYSHFPRVGIGHWPPLFHFIQAALFLLTGVSLSAAIVFQAVIAGATSAVVTTVIARRTNIAVGVCAGISTMAVDQFSYSLNTVMLDNFVGLLILLTALAWSAYARTKSTNCAVAFGAFAAAAILTKGNAYGLALLPVVHAVLSKRMDLLLSARTYVAAIVVATLTLPWYALTYKLASSGFNYGWGLAYTAMAGVSFIQGLPVLLGIFALVALVAGSAITMGEAWLGRRDEVALSALSGATAIFAFICIVPADISPRYLLDLLPCSLLVAVLGLDRLSRLILPWAAERARQPVIAALLAANVIVTFHQPHLATLKMETVAEAILRSGDENPLVLISGTTRAEGALIAAFAQKDRKRSHFIVRGTKAIASSDFMGKDYELRFAHTADLQHWIEQSKVGWVVITDTPTLPNMPHMRQMEELEATHPERWSLVLDQSTETSHTRVFRVAASAPTHAEVIEVLKQLGPMQTAGIE